MKEPGSQELEIPDGRETEDSFDRMWETFPEKVLLLNRDRRVIRANRTGRDQGAEPGLRCFELAGRDRVCPHCRAEEALAKGETIDWSGPSRGRFFCAFWIPMNRPAGWYVHFAVNISAHVRPELLACPPEELGLEGDGV